MGTKPQGSGMKALCRPTSKNRQGVVAKVMPDEAASAAVIIASDTQLLRRCTFLELHSSTSLNRGTVLRVESVSQDVFSAVVTDVGCEKMVRSKRLAAVSRNRERNDIMRYRKSSSCSHWNLSYESLHIYNLKKAHAPSS